MVDVIKPEGVLMRRQRPEGQHMLTADPSYLTLTRGRTVNYCIITCN